MWCTERLACTVPWMLVLAACSGRIGDAADRSGSRDPASTGAGTAVSDPLGTGACGAGTSRRVRRLSQREYLNVVTDLLGAASATTATPMLLFEPRVAGFANQDSDLLVSSAYQGA